MDASASGFEEIIRRLDELKAGQAGLEGRMDALQAGLEGRLDKLHVEMEWLTKEIKDLRVSTTDSHQIILGNIQSLEAASVRNKEDVADLARRWG